jgi:broad-specificity NMP kinase
MIVWLCGRPGVGKSTTLKELEILLEEQDISYEIFDGTRVQPNDADVTLVANAHDEPKTGAKVVFLETSRESYIPEHPDVRLIREHTAKHNAEVLCHRICNWRRNQES